MKAAGVRVSMLSVGGALGVNARYWMGVWLARWVGPHFPWATLAINVSGCFAIGFLTLALTRWLPHPNARLLVLVGFLGGYTTFSTFMFESVELCKRGEAGRAAAYVSATLIGGFAAVTSGTALARALVLRETGQGPTREKIRNWARTTVADGSEEARQAADSGPAQPGGPA